MGGRGGGGREIWILNFGFWIGEGNAHAKAAKGGKGEIRD